MKNQDGGEIWHIRLGFETVSWQHAAHILDSCRAFLENAKIEQAKERLCLQGGAVSDALESTLPQTSNRVSHNVAIGF